MSEQEKGAEKEPINCKVVLIGKSGVGKTSIISRYTANTFKETLMSTPGANFLTKTVFIQDENENIKFEIWDTAGQERYRSLAKVFYKNAAACILVYDITDKSSFEDVKSYWAPELKENAPSNIGKKLSILIFKFFLFIVIALAGNKSDNYMSEEVTDNEGKALAKEINAIYKRTSAKLNSSIDEMFNDIGKKFLNPNSEITSNLTKEEMIQKSEKLRRDKIKSNTGTKKSCC